MHFYLTHKVLISSSADIRNAHFLTVHVRVSDPVIRAGPVVDSDAVLCEH
jgi:hypothetical protein